MNARDRYDAAVDDVRTALATVDHEPVTVAELDHMCGECDVGVYLATAVLDLLAVLDELNVADLIAEHSRPRVRGAVLGRSSS